VHNPRDLILLHIELGKMYYMQGRKEEAHKKLSDALALCESEEEVELGKELNYLMLTISNN